MGVRGIDQNVPGRDGDRGGHGLPDFGGIGLVDIGEIEGEDRHAFRLGSHDQGAHVNPVEHSGVGTLRDPIERARIGRKIDGSGAGAKPRSDGGQEGGGYEREQDR